MNLTLQFFSPTYPVSVTMKFNLKQSAKGLILIVACVSLFLLFQERFDSGTSSAIPLPVSDTTFANRLYATAERFTNASQYDSANYYFEKALPVYEKENQWEMVISGRNYIGDNFRAKGDYQKSITYLSETLALGNEKLAGKTPAKATTLNKIGLFYRDKRESEKALDYFNRALLMRLQVLNPDHPDIGWSYNNIGLVQWDLGSYSLSLEMYNKAVRIISAGSGENSPDLAFIYANMGIIYKEKGDDDKALDYYNRSLKIRLETFGPDHLMLSQNYMNIGNIYYKKEDFDEALRFYRQALSIRMAKLVLSHPYVAEAYYNMGFVCKSKKQYPAARNYYSQALTIWTKKFGTNYPSNAGAHDEIGQLFYEEGRYDSALYHFQMALQIWSHIDRKSYRLSYIYNDMGHVYLKLHNFPKALELYEKSLAVNKKNFGERHSVVAESYLNIANAYLEEEDYGRSLIYNDKATHALTRDSSSSGRLFDILDESKWVAAQEMKGDIYQCLSRRHSEDDGYLEKSLTAYEEATRSVIRMRQGFKSENSKLYLGEKAIPIFEKAVATALKIFKTNEDTATLEQAFELTERSKASVLLESLFDSKAKIFAGIPDSLLEYESQMRIRIHFFQKKMLEEQQKGGGSDAPRVIGFQSNMFDAIELYDKYISNMEQKYPQYYRLKFQFRPVTIRQIQNVLDKNTSVIEYFVGDSTVFIFSIRAAHASVFAVAKDASFEKNVENVRRGLVERDYMRYSQSSFALYEQIIRPVHSRIRTRNLIIIPDGLLGYIPFEALITSSPGTRQDYAKLSYLIQEYTISYAYSATLLFEGFNMKPAGSNNLIGFSPAVFKN
jgi:tetratricopeptide (TPR) repeat protein